MVDVGGRALPEEPEIRQLIAGVAEAAAAGGSRFEVASDRLSDLVRRYRECPALLEPLVAELVPRLCEAARARWPRRDDGELVYAYHLVRARGYKRGVVHLPHEVALLDPLLAFIEAERPDDREAWRERFLALLWLSIVVMMPFRMSLLDANVKSGPTVADRIFDVCKTYSSVTDSCFEAAAFLTSKYLTRSDTLEKYLGEFFEWSRCQNENLQDEVLVKYGVLASVAGILKHGKREDLLPYADGLFRWIIERDYRSSKSINVRKYGIKIIQRLGLILLKPKIATWRYIREKSSLAINLNMGNKSSNVEPNNPGLSRTMEQEDSEDQDIPEQIEEIMEHLLTGLRDNDNVVRWSAAKGIGRVSARLNSSAASDIVSGIMDLFNPREGDGAWHGGCLALAELGRRGILLKCHLRDALKVVSEALQYEEVRGHTPTGSHVRDAACYVCWAFVRAYTDDLNPYIEELIIGLLITAVYDREINCRLAARAAFEESVGRLQIINKDNLGVLTADEFYLSSVKKAYLSAAPYLASTNVKYTKPLIDHLAEKKVCHWDMNIRELAAKSLHLLTKEDPRYMIDVILPSLIKKTASSDLNTRHGSILAIGEIAHALKLTNESVNLPSGLVDDIRNIVPILQSKYQLRGLGGELMRQACCSYIENISMAQLPYHEHSIIDDWLLLIEDCLSHEVNIIRSKAIPSLAALFNEYLNDGSQEKMEKRKILIEKYYNQLSALGSNGLYARMGFALAIGALPSFTLEEHLPQIVSSLIKCTEITEPTLKWAESRRDALKGLTSVCKTVGIEKIEQCCDSNMEVIFQCLLRCLVEYTLEIRGDVGALVREASMAGISSLCKQCSEECITVFKPDLVKNIFAGLAQQAVEKIDRTRALAGKAFTSLLYCSPSIPYIPHYEELCELFPQNLIFDERTNKPQIDKSSSLYANEDDESSTKKTVLWLFPCHTMPLFVKLLAWESYRYNVMLGLVTSAGAMTESLVKHTTAALFSYLTTLYNDKEQIFTICNTIIEVFSKNNQVDRVIVPLLKFLDSLLSSGCANSVLEDPSGQFASDILELVGKEMSNCDMYKKLDCISVICQLIQVGGVICRKCFNKLVIHLCSPNKHIRKSTASKLYDALLLYGDSTSVIPENMDQIMALLADTNWELDVATLRPIRNELCELMGVQKPNLMAKKSSA